MSGDGTAASVCERAVARKMHAREVLFREGEPDVVFATRPPESISRDLRVLRKLQRDGLYCECYG